MFKHFHRNPQRNTVLLLCVIIGIGVALRTISALILPIDGDEGQLIYMGHLVLQGAVPLRDLVPPPDPLYVWILAFTEIFLGPTLLAVRGLSIVFSIVGAIGVWLVTGQLARKRIAFLATGVYSLSPAIILYTSIGSYRNVAFAIVVFAFYFLVLGLKNNNAKSLLVAGFIIGISILTYRINAAFLLAVPLLFLLLDQNPRHLVRRVGIVLAGGLVATAPVVALLISLSSFSWINMVWGVGGGPGSLSDFALSSQPGTGLWQSLLAYFEFRSRVSFVTSREWFHLILPSMLGLLYLLRRNQQKWPITVRAVILGGLIGYLYMVLRGQSLQPRGQYGTYDVWPGFDYATMVIVLLGSLLVVSYPRTENREPNNQLRDVTVYWMCSLLIAFAILRIVHVYYFIAFAPVLSMLAAVGIYNIGRDLRVRLGIHPHSRRIATLAVSLIVLSTLIAALSMYQTPVLERDVTQNQAATIGNYLRVHTQPKDEILTGNLIYSVTAGRDNAMKISNPWIYLQGSDNPFGVNQYGSTPSITELDTYLSLGAIKYVVMDHQLIVMTNQQPQLNQTINTHFELETVIQNVPLYHFKR